MIGSLLVNTLAFLVFAPAIVCGIVATCWPLFSMIDLAIKNIGFKINKKYNNGLAGLILERYAVKK